MSGIRFTEAEDRWLIDNINNPDFLSWEEITKRFNEIFPQRNAGSLRDRCTKRLKLHRDNNSGRFGINGNKKSAAPIGTEREFGDYVFVKVDDVCTEDKNSDFRINWQQKQRYVYEQATGRKVKKGEIVIFLDSNNRNFNPDNLYCLPRSIHSTMCRFDWYSDNPDLTLSAIKCLELRKTAVNLLEGRL